MAGKVITHPTTGVEFWLDQTYMYDTPYHSGKRSNPLSRKYIVVHHTAGSTAGDLKVLRGLTSTKASVKFLVCDPQDGNYKDAAGRLVIYQLLPEEVIGWSIGTSTGDYAYVTNANSDSIEISNLGTGTDTFEEVQVQAVEALIAYEEDRLNQELTIFAHYETSPGRKVDPYKTFPMARVKQFAAAHVHDSGGTTVSYRHVAGWAETQASRDAVKAKADALGMRVTVDGPAFEFHGILDEVKQVESLIAADPKSHRFNGVLVEEGTHRNMGVADGIGTQPWNVTVGATPPPSVDCAEEIAALKAQVASLTAQVVSLTSQLGKAEEVITSVDATVDAYNG